MTTNNFTFTTSPLFRSAAGSAITTGIILMIPLIMMQFSTEVDWSVSDFVLAGLLLFTAGFALWMAFLSKSSSLQKLAAGSWIGIIFLMTWANLAVGLIGSGPNTANLMFIGVIAVAVAGAIISKFQYKGMAKTLMATLAAHIIVMGISLVLEMHKMPGISLTEILGINGFFMLLWAGSGLMFRLTAR
jgi:hypothetical protein